MAGTGTVKCVRIKGSTSGTGPYSTAAVKADSLVFDNPPTPTSVLWDFPLVIHKLADSQLDNQHATWLMINDETGFAPFGWQGRIGDVIVARQDQKDLSLDVLAVVVDYISDLLDAFGDMGSVNPKIWYTPERFRNYVRKRLPNVKDEDIQSIPAGTT